jgi:beta-ketoacyl-acyl-carrier-protein synthase II
MMSVRVVVTGMGTINPLGASVDESWENALAGKPTVGPITAFDASGYLSQIACEVRGFDPTKYVHPKESRRMDRFQHFAAGAAQEAMAQAGLDDFSSEENPVAVVVSSAVGGLISLSDGMKVLLEQGPRRVSPFTIPMFMPNGLAGMLAIKYGAKGPCFSVASACATGTDSLGQAWVLLRSGAVDVALAGGAEATVTEIGISTFDRVGALSRRNEPGAPTPSPFDKNRDGFVMGEGAAIFVLETLEHALARGAEPLAEFVGYGSTCDAHHMTAPHPEGAGGVEAIKTALVTGELQPEQVDYINAHGTGTELNDVAETLAIKSAFGEAATQVAISSSKSMTGHMMGATGALEAIFSVMAIRSNQIPPTINLHDPDPQCDLDYVPNQSREKPVQVALSNSFGFGGHNAVVAFQEHSG